MFNLPSGYTVNSLNAGILNNHFVVPETETLALMMLAAGLLALLAALLRQIVTLALGLTKLIAARSSMKQPFSGLFGQILGNNETSIFQLFPACQFWRPKSGRACIYEVRRAEKRR